MFDYVVDNIIIKMYFFLDELVFYIPAILSFKINHKSILQISMFTDVTLYLNKK